MIVKLIAGTYTNSATTDNSEDAIASTLVKRRSEGNILTAFTNAAWSTPALAIDGTLPSNIVDKTLEIGVMYHDG